MSAREPIRRLGELYGIDPSYTDFFGKRRQVPMATEHALLQAMGAAVGSAREIADSLREARGAAVAAHAGAGARHRTARAAEVTFTLPAGLGGATIDWALSEEAGGVHEGRLTPDELPEVAAAEVDGTAYRRWRMALPSALPQGYHRLSMAVRGDAQVHGSLQLIVAPARCHRPAPRSRLWGVTAQLYGVRSQRNWGMGDFTDLADLTERAAALGASAVGVNPLHALFPADANHISPYSPSSRLFLNVFYLDPAAVPDLAESSEARAMLGDGGFRRELENARAAELVDYLGGVASQAARARAPVRVLPEAPPCRLDRAGAGVPRFSRGDGPGARAACGVRCAARACACRPAGPGPGMTGRRRCSGRTPPRSPRSRASIVGASTSSPTCNGWPISNSGPRRGAPAPPACRSACTRTSRSG